LPLRCAPRRQFLGSSRDDPRFRPAALPSQRCRERIEDDRQTGMVEKKPQGKKCPAIDGIIEEGQEIAKEYKGSPALDSGLLAAAQAVEHYEISRYGTLRTWAQELGMSRAVTLLETTLKEEKNTDQTLTKLPRRA
jgi:ferritin-like metal-binding protein YciE